MPQAKQMTLWLLIFLFKCVDQTEEVPLQSEQFFMDCSNKMWSVNTLVTLESKEAVLLADAGLLESGSDLGFFCFHWLYKVLWGPFGRDLMQHNKSELIYCFFLSNLCHWVSIEWDKEIFRFRKSESDLVDLLMGARCQKTWGFVLQVDCKNFYCRYCLCNFCPV